MCTVLGVARSTYYKSFDKIKSVREIENNEELKAAIIRIYEDNKGIYGAPMIHHILGTEGLELSLKRVKRLILHTGLGSQYTSNYLKELCKEFNITQSFSKKDCPYDNACIESFHSSIKKEEIYRNTYYTF
ncbi:hypothetical protein EI377_12155 [Clostridium septicum]|nr:hypothetical protein EI377_12155 [Clostridium septicum]